MSREGWKLAALLAAGVLLGLGLAWLGLRTVLQ